MNIEQASATQAADKTSILNSIAFPRSRTIALNSNYSTNHPSYQMVNRALASHFALAAMYTSYLQGQDVSNLLVALQADEARTSLQLSLTECHEFTDEKLSTLLEHLPRSLQNLRLDLGFTGLKCFPVFPGSNIALQKLVLRFTGSLQSIVGFSTMLQHLQPSLRHLELWFSNLPFLEDLQFGPGNDSLLRLQLVELMLYVEGCPLVSKTSKQSLCLGVLSTACWPIMSYIIYPHEVIYSLSFVFSYSGQHEIKASSPVFGPPELELNHFKQHHEPGNAFSCLRTSSPHVKCLWHSGSVNFRRLHGVSEARQMKDG